MYDRLGLSKHLVIESKVFSLLENGSLMLITKGSWKVVNELRMGLSTMQWFAKTLQNCLKVRKDFYTMVREGNHSFIVQLCSNVRNCYMALMEYGVGSKCSFIFILEKMECNGWRRMAEGLWEFANEGRDLSHNRGGASMRSLVMVLQPQIRSYKEGIN